MRVLESANYPLTKIPAPFITKPGMPNGYLEITRTGLSPTPQAIQSNYLPGTFTLFPQPRLGRRWTVDRFVVNNINIYQDYGDILTPIDLSLNYSILLNDVPIGEPLSIVYEMSRMIPLPSQPISIAYQNGPKSITPFNALEVNSGDQLKLVISWGTNRGFTDPANDNGFAIWAQSLLQIVGSNDPVT